LGPGFHTGGFTVAFGHGHPVMYKSLTGFFRKQNAHFVTGTQPGIRRKEKEKKGRQI